jgi:hypothetical protein
MPMLRGLRWRELPPALAKWAVAKGLLRAKPPARARQPVSARPTLRQEISALIKRAVPISAPKNYRDVTALPVTPEMPVQPRIAAAYKDTAIGTERLLPPSLLDWATQRGVKVARAESVKPRDPFKTRTAVIALERRSQIMAALNRGEWCYVWETAEVFPPRLQRWLIERNVVLIRCFGRRRFAGGSPLGQANAPLNGYVTESGVVFYVAENGTTFYVQET